MKKAAGLTMYVLFAAALVAQDTGRPAFEVASIKANKSGIPGKLGMGFHRAA